MDLRHRSDLCHLHDRQLRGIGFVRRYFVVVALVLFQGVRVMIENLIRLDLLSSSSQSVPPPCIV